ncbi:MAG: dienelactone hydrolase family protein [Candidatus Tectomicrobia bacterium]|uniref:Dienelactone hydrolase family protein n=1 Tax=Tectimicrobiota bacterium TaxID=2528274 RepID=A0A932M0H9_UNCTE|nr:dienelactone hydrolase family protein [Candidatus Tectomicrobia bacterium]
MEGSIENLVEQYGEGAISRRSFIQKGAILLGSTAAATTLVESLRFNPAVAAVVEPDDPNLISSAVEYPGDGFTMHGYLSRPKAAGKRGGLIVIHENRGINDHIRDVARRAAKEGMAALAPDLLSRAGGTDKFTNPDDAIAAINKLTSTDLIKDLQSSFTYLKGLDTVIPGKIGVIGFCWGGANSLLFSTQNRELAATVVFYGRNPNPIDLVRNLPGPILGIYGERDTGITSKVPELEEALKKYNKLYEIKIYPGAQHAFHNETNPSRYNPEAARDAWARAMVFLKKNLQS